MLWVGEQLCVQLAGQRALWEKRGSSGRKQEAWPAEAGASSAAPRGASERLVLVLN